MRGDSQIQRPSSPCLWVSNPSQNDTDKTESSELPSTVTKGSKSFHERWGTHSKRPARECFAKDPACPSGVSNTKLTVKIAQAHQTRRAEYAPSRCGPEGQDLLKRMQIWLHRELCQEAVLREDGKVPSPSALRVVMGKVRQCMGRQARGRKGEGASLAHPFNKQAVIMTELHSLAVRQP